MFNRLRWIATSYVTCPMTLTCLAVSAVLTVFAVLATPRFGQNNVAPPFPRPLPAICSAADLEQARSRHQQAQVKGIDLQQLYFSAATRPELVDHDVRAANLYELLDELPNLEWVNVGTLAVIQNFPAVQDRLKKLAQLEYLSLDLAVAQHVMTGDLAWLKSLPKLRWLELTKVNDEPNLAGLAELPALETLALTNVGPITGRQLAQIARLPHLKTLILAPLRHPVGTVLPGGERAALPADYEVLRSTPNLQTIYFGQWRFSEEGNPAAPIQAALPELSVYPATVLTRSDAMPLTVSFICAFLAWALANQLAVEFRGAPSRLLPQFGWSHAVAAAVWLAAVVAVTCCLLVQIGLSLPIGLALATTLTLALVAAGTLALLSVGRTQTPGTAVPWMVFFSGLLFPFLIWMSSRPWWFELYPGATLLTCALVTVGLAGQLVRRLRPQVEVTPDVTRPGSSVLLPSSGWRGRLWDPSRVLRKTEQQIEALSGRQGSWTWWRRIRRWQIGNGSARLRMVSQIFVASFLAAVILLTRQWRDAQQSILGEIDLPNLMAFAFVVVLMQTVLLGTWKERARSLPLESLRPVWNRDFRLELATALALDIAPIALVFAAGEAVAWNLDEQYRINWLGLPGSFFIFLALGFSVVLAGMSISIVVRRGWLALGIVLVATFFCIVAVPGAAVLQLHVLGQLPDSPPPPAALLKQAIEMQLWIPILVATLLTLFAAWRWREMELTNLG